MKPSANLIVPNSSRPCKRRSSQTTREPASRSRTHRRQSLVLRLVHEMQTSDRDSRLMEKSTNGKPSGKRPWGKQVQGVNFRGNQCASCKLDIQCKILEDNSAALAMATKVLLPKRQPPRTKLVKVKHHHFRNHVANGKISLHTVASANQVAGITQSLCNWT